MIMFTGGAHQNKTKLAEEMTGITAAVTADGEVCSEAEALNAKCVRNYHALVKRIYISGGDPVKFTEKLCNESPDAVIIMDETGCGIVPVDRDERLIREATGRCGCMIARKSHTVVRVCCGIPTIIKGDKK